MNKRHPPFSFVFLIGMFFVVFNGCGTIWSIHSYEKTESLLYSGLRTDIDIIVDPPVAPIPMPLGGYILFCFDVPFSLLVDTLLLPYTLVQHFTREEKEENVLGSENSSEKAD